MGKVTLTIQGGGLNRTSTNKDKYAGLIIEVAALPSGWTNDAVKTLYKPEDLVQYNVDINGSPTTSDKHIYYHVSEFFRLNPTGVLYVGLTTDTFDVTKLDLITAVDSGVRLIGYNAVATVAGELAHLNALQTALEGTFTDDKLPVHCIFSGQDSTIDVSAVSVSSDDHIRVSYDICQDLTTGSLAKDVLDNNSGQCGATGTWLGLYCGRPVHQKPSWVETGDLSGKDWTDFGVIEGTSTKLKTQAEIEAYAVKGINIPRLYPRSTGTYMSGSRSCSVASNDYAVTNNARVIDKVSALVYDALLPSVDRPAYVNTTTGKLSRDTIEFLRTAAYDAIQNNMIQGRTGNNIELSVDPDTGKLPVNSVFIDPDQNILSDETINVRVGVVPVGASKIINVTIGLSATV